MIRIGDDHNEDDNKYDRDHHQVQLPAALTSTPAGHHRLITTIIDGDDHKDGQEGDHKYDQDESENEGGSSENLNQIL